MWREKQHLTPALCLQLPLMEILLQSCMSFKIGWRLRVMA